ncbi:ion transporter [Methanohalophilus sp.]|uniref:ion transporter n=1 Tax=Methanohalophilus sp. TaxID=1966352 RepID=UPI002638A138|nr:ion transporter [Methanohalophilus sp.]MDK2892449.1 voltage-gated potassium channel [Methanohalophilus sp.]
MKSKYKYENAPEKGSWKESIYNIIFEADTPAGKYFDLLLILVIVASVLVVMLDSVQSISTTYHDRFYLMEWGFTILFTMEYLLRIACVRDKKKYALSFFGIIDLIAVLPTYLSILLPGGQYLLVIRSLRLLRIFRILKLVQYLTEAELLIEALRESQRKIVVFLFAVLNLVIILGSFMYVVENENPDFTSIPESIYWAITTITTVGYGDIVPTTPLGHLIASIIMITGFSIIAVPTGIVTHTIIKVSNRETGAQIFEQEDSITSKTCSDCGLDTHDNDASYCKRCGAKL